MKEQRKSNLALSSSSFVITVYCIICKMVMMRNIKPKRYFLCIIKWNSKYYHPYIYMKIPCRIWTQVVMLRIVLIGYFITYLFVNFVVLPFCILSFCSILFILICFKFSSTKVKFNSITWFISLIYLISVNKDLL